MHLCFLKIRFFHPQVSNQEERLERIFYLTEGDTVEHKSVKGKEYF